MPLSSNDTIKNLIGASNQPQNSKMEPSNPSLRNIATNGALLNQNLSVLIQKISTLTKAWGG